MKSILRSGLILMAALFAFAMVAQADSFDLGATAGTPVTGWDANATLSASGGTFTLTMTFNNTSGVAATINSWALQLFNANAGESFTVTSATLNGSPLSSPWEYFGDTKVNNGGTPNCSGNANRGWLCVDTAAGGSLSPVTVAAGTSDTFIFTGTYSGTSPVTLDLMSSGTVGGSKWAISGTAGGTSVPEPSSFLLLGVGLAGALALKKALA